MNYIDRDGNPMPDDLYTNSEPRKRPTRWATDMRVGITDVGDVRVSTVWLMGINHEWRSGYPPLVFETMIFGGDYNEDVRRYATEEQAMRGHLEAVDRIRAGLTPFEIN